MDSNRIWLGEKRLEKTAKALEKHGMPAFWVPDVAEAMRRILAMVPAGATVGIGGSSTIRQIGLIDALIQRGHEVFDHWKPGLAPEQQLAIRKAQTSSDVFISSSNAVTEEGELVNIDGIGNRTNAMIFGPGKVIVVAGINKIVPDVKAALWRVKHVAAPMNARRLGLKTPCGATGECNECDSPGRQCRVTTIIERKPGATDLHIVLVNEELGF